MGWEVGGSPQPAFPQEMLCRAKQQQRASSNISA